MKTDISRNTFRREKHYNAVRLKQNRLLTDADWNEQVDIQNYIRRTKLRDSYGSSGVPGVGGGFQIGATGTDLTISQGRIYVDGILCENPSAAVFTAQTDLPGQSLPGDGLYLAYLDVWERGVSRVEAGAEIRETALGGPDTATRAQLLNQVKLLYIGDGSVDAGRFETPPEFSALTSAERGRMSARTRAADVGSDPCDIGERGGYSSQENRLYRVEIHSAGGVAGGANPATATFKWSRENATIASELLELAGNSLTVRSTGRDRAVSFQAGDWLEIIDEGREQAGEAGTLALIQEIVGETLIVDPDSLRHFDGSEGDARELTLADFSRGVVRVRRWDMTGAIGAVSVPAAGEWLELENGIQILFEDDDFRVGDAWLIPARAATRNVEWPRDDMGSPLPQPAGPEHRYAPLAYVRSLAGVWEVRADLRTELSVLTKAELFYVGGDGQQGMPGEELDTALSVRVGSGPQAIAGAKIRFEIIQGTGVLQDAPGGVDQGTSFVAETDGDGNARAGLRLDAVNEHQRVEAVLLNPEDGSDSQYLVRFNANLNLATAVENTGDVPDPLGQNLMDGVATVDEALNRLGEIKVNRAGDTIAGSLVVQQDFDVVGDLTVRGDVLVQDTNNLPGSTTLGNNDADEIILHAELDSGHSSDRLVVDDTAHVVQDVDVDGRIGIGTNAPSQKLTAVGIIEAREGGLVFPDGTLQTTAGASGGGVPTGYCIPGRNPVAPAGFTESMRAIDAGGEFAQWTARASMTVARQRAAVGVLNGRIYVAGGHATSGARAENEEYDPLTNLWRNRAVLPTANGHLASAGYQDRLYVFGGSVWSGPTITGATDATRVYDPHTNGWTVLTSMPAARGSAVAVLVDTRMYVIGGTAYSGGSLNVNEAFDPHTNSWERRAPMLAPGSDLTVAAAGGKVYLFGTTPGLNGVEVYDPIADAWSSRGPMPFAGFGMIAAVIDQRIHLVGGINGGADLNIYKIYDPARDIWSDGPLGMSLRHNGAGAVVDNTIYYLTGQVQGPPGDIAINEAYSPPVQFAVHCKIEESADPPSTPQPFLLDWTSRANLPAPCAGGTAAVVDGRLYLIGGDDTGGLSTTNVYQYDPASDAWADRAAMPTARSFCASAVYNGRIYVFSGTQNGTIQTVNEVYDPRADIWSTASPVPSIRNFVGATLVNGKIYVIGGANSVNTPLATNEVYDPATDSWLSRQPMDVPRESPVVIAIGGQVYAIGGIDGTTYYGVNEVYDPTTNVWTTLQPMPTARFGATAVAVNEKIYVMGGATGSGVTDVVEEYDPSTDSWRTVDLLGVARRYIASAVVGRTIHSIGGEAPGALDTHEAISIPATTTRVPLPAPRASHTTEAIGGKLYLNGGYALNAAIYQTETYEYDPAVNAWTAKASSATGRYEAMSGVVNDRMYVIGGGAGPTGATPLDVNEVYDPATNLWALRTAMPTERRDGAAASDGTRIHVVGGFNTVNVNVHEVYDPGTDSWSTAAPMPTIRRSLSAVFLDGLLYVIGGFLSSSNLTGVNEVYNPGTDSWSTLAPMSIPRDKTAIFARAGRIYVVGGRTSSPGLSASTIVEEYNPATDSWRRMPDLRLLSGYNSAAIIDDRAYIVGGRDATQAASDHQLIIFEN